MLGWNLYINRIDQPTVCPSLECNSKTYYPVIAVASNHKTQQVIIVVTEYGKVYGTKGTPNPLHATPVNPALFVDTSSVL